MNRVAAAAAAVKRKTVLFDEEKKDEEDQRIGEIIGDGRSAAGDLHAGIEQNQQNRAKSRGPRGEQADDQQNAETHLRIPKQEAECVDDRGREPGFVKLAVESRGELPRIHLEFIDTPKEQDETQRGAEQRVGERFGDSFHRRVPFPSFL